MSVLVTGGAGYIGSHMALALLDRGEDVVVLDDLSAGFEWAVPTGCRFIEGNVGDRALVATVLREHRVGAIAHFAGSLLVGESVRQPLRYYDNNVGGLCSLLDGAVAAGIDQFIFSSTAAVYGNVDGRRVSEDDRLDPLSPYGRSKLMGETILADVLAAHGVRHAILRYFNVAGADPERRAGESTLDTTHLVKVALESALGKRPGMHVFGTDYPTRDGTAIRDYVHVSDLAAAHLAALDRLRAGGDSLTANVGYGRGFSVREVLNAVSQVTGLDTRAADAPRRAGDPASIVADATRLRDETGWTPRHDDLDEIVAHAFEWEKHLSRRNG